MLSIRNKLKRKFADSPIVARIAQGTFWAFSGTASAKFLILLAGIICARILGKDGYGQLGIVRSTVNLFVSLGSAAMGITAAKYIAQYKNTDKKKAADISVITRLFASITGILATAAILILADVLAKGALHAPTLVSEIRIGAILLFVTILNGAQNGILSGFEDFKSIARNTFIASVAEGTLMIVGAWIYGVFGAVLGFGLGYVVLYFCNRLSIQSDFKRYTIKPDIKKIQLRDFRVLYRFSLPAALSGILVMPAYWVVRMLIVRYNGFGELGVYEAAEQWRIIILFIPGTLSQIVLPILSNVLEEGSKNSFWKIIWINIALNAFISFILSLLVLLCGSWLMALNGKDFVGSNTITFLAFSTVFSSIATIVGNAITSKERVWEGLGFNFFWALLFIGLSWFGLSKGYASEGVAVALLTTYLIHSSLQLIYLKMISR